MRMYRFRSARACTITGIAFGADTGATGETKYRVQVGGAPIAEATYAANQGSSTNVTANVVAVGGANLASYQVGALTDITVHALATAEDATLSDLWFAITAEVA